MCTVIESEENKDIGMTILPVPDEETKTFVWEQYKSLLRILDSRQVEKNSCCTLDVNINLFN